MTESIQPSFSPTLSLRATLKAGSLSPKTMEAEPLKPPMSFVESLQKILTAEPSQPSIASTATPEHRRHVFAAAPLPSVGTMPRPEPQVGGRWLRVNEHAVEGVALAPLCGDSVLGDMPLRSKPTARSLQELRSRLDNENVTVPQPNQPLMQNLDFMDMSFGLGPLGGLLDMAEDGLKDLSAATGLQSMLESVLSLNHETLLPQEPQMLQTQPQVRMSPSLRD